MIGNRYDTEPLGYGRLNNGFRFHSRIGDVTRSAEGVHMKVRGDKMGAIW